MGFPRKEPTYVKGSKTELAKNEGWDSSTRGDSFLVNAGTMAFVMFIIVLFLIFCYSGGNDCTKKKE